MAIEQYILKDLPEIYCDEDRIGQVLINLIGNALQYTPAGGKVMIDAHNIGQFLQVDITDSGIGIEPEHIPLFFERFYRMDKSRSRAHGSSGIGLTITKYWVEAHGGKIWVESGGLGMGSTFSFTLPVE